MEVWLTKDDVAKMLGVCKQTVLRLMNDNKIVYYKSGTSRTSRVRFKKSDVENYIKQMQR